MTAPDFIHLIRTEDEMTDFAQRVAAQLSPGDTLLLEGDIGSGKSFFARALIQSLQDVPEHVPSPTFTLVQTYDTSKGEVWHADLYRLGDPSELDELGLTEAFEAAICLIEWPDRLGEAAPEGAVTLRFDLTDVEGERKISAQTETTMLFNKLTRLDDHD